MRVWAYTRFLHSGFVDAEWVQRRYAASLPGELLLQVLHIHHVYQLNHGVASEYDVGNHDDNLPAKSLKRSLTHFPRQLPTAFTQEVGFKFANVAWNVSYYKCEGCLTRS